MSDLTTIIVAIIGAVATSTTAIVTTIITTRAKRDERKSQATDSPPMTAPVAGSSPPAAQPPAPVVPILARSPLLRRMGNISKWVLVISSSFLILDALSPSSVHMSWTSWWLTLMLALTFSSIAVILSGMLDRALQHLKAQNGR